MTGVLLSVRLVVTIWYVICNSCPWHINCMVAHCSFFQIFFIGVLSFLLITRSKICLNFRLYKNGHKTCASLKHNTNNVPLLFILLIFFSYGKKFFLEQDKRRVTWCPGPKARQFGIEVSLELALFNMFNLAFWKSTDTSFVFGWLCNIVYWPLIVFEMLFRKSFTQSICLDVLLSVNAFAFHPFFLGYVDSR